MTTRFSTGALKSIADTTSLAGTFGSCVIDIYTGTQPATADTAATGTKLVTVSLNGAGTAISWDAATGGVLPKAVAETWKGTISQDGNAGWFRIRKTAHTGTTTSTTEIRADGAISTSGGELTVGSLVLSAGAPFEIQTFTLTLPTL